MSSMQEKYYKKQANFLALQKMLGPASEFLRIAKEIDLKQQVYLLGEHVYHLISSDWLGRIIIFVTALIGKAKDEIRKVLASSHCSYDHN